MCLREHYILAAWKLGEQKLRMTRVFDPKLLRSFTQNQIKCPDRNKTGFACQKYFIFFFLWPNYNIFRIFSSQNWTILLIELDHRITRSYGFNLHVSHPIIRPINLDHIVSQRSVETRVRGLSAPCPRFFKKFMSVSVFFQYTWSQKDRFDTIVNS